MSELSVEFKGVDFDVEFNYQPEERDTRWTPGCGESIDIISIKHKGVDFDHVFENYHDEFEQLISEAIHANPY